MMPTHIAVAIIMIIPSQDMFANNHAMMYFAFMYVWDWYTHAGLYLILRFG